MVTIGTLVDRLSPAPTPGILEQMEQLPAIDDEVDHVEAINGNVQSDGSVNLINNFNSAIRLGFLYDQRVKLHQICT